MYVCMYVCVCVRAYMHVCMYVCMYQWYHIALYNWSLTRYYRLYTLVLKTPDLARKFQRCDIFRHVRDIFSEMTIKKCYIY